MSSGPPQLVYAHRTPKAQERKANVFIWWPSGSIAACFNAQLVQVSAETILRWLDMTAALRYFATLPVVIKRVELKRPNILHYFPRPIEPGLAPSETLTAGVYGCYSEDPEAEISTHGAYSEVSSNARPFSYDLEATAEWIEERPLDTWPAENLEGYYTAMMPSKLRDGMCAPHDTCIFTGYKSEPGDSFGSAAPDAVEICWIYPVFMSTSTDPMRYAPREVHISDIKVYTPHNVVSMRADLVKLWHDNAFGVDVDDGYQIRTFTEEAARAGLPARLNALAPEWDVYLREQFRHTLAVQIIGGNWEEYHEPTPDMSVFHRHYRRARRDGIELDPNDDVWKSDLGKEALSWFMVQEAETRSGIERDCDYPDW